MLTFSYESLFNLAIAKLKRDSYEKVSTVVIPEGPVELKTTAYID
eukprot:COSAG02_NODE_72083_length_188_cov_18.584270_1_plen_44_part_01